MRLRAALTVAALVVAGLVVAPASASTGTTATAGVVTGSGLGFDAADTPSTAVIRAWTASPYRSVNIYFAGSQRYHTSQPNLTNDWVTTVLSNNWSLIPTDVDLQAPTPCYSGPKASTTAATAVADGTNAATTAIAALRALGLDRTIAYLDLEPFDVTKNSTCAATVIAYTDAWTRTLHGAGFKSGVYVSVNYGLQTFVSNYADPYRPDDIWIARWDGQATTSSYIPSTMWVHHRIHQYYSDDANGTGSETYGGETLGVDRNAIDGDVVRATSVRWPSGPPYTYYVSGTPSNNLNERPQPNTTQPPAATAQNGDALSIVCQAIGETVDGDSVWDKLTNGYYVSDIYTTTTGGNGLSPRIARCDKTPPTVTLGALAPSSVSASATVTWSASDPTNPNGERSGISSSLVRYHRAAWNGGFGAWQTLGTTTGRSMRLPLAAGYDYCVVVRSYDLSGNGSYWSAQRCVARALDDPSLTAGSGWTRGKNTHFYMGTYTQATRSGRVLTRANATATRLALVATTCSRCGSVRVSIAGHYVATVSLYSAATHWQQLLPLPSFALRTGTVVVTTTDSRLVQIDGLVIARA